jgi:hypothetical protein
MQSENRSLLSAEIDWPASSPASNVRPTVVSMYTRSSSFTPTRRQFMQSMVASTSLPQTNVSEEGVSSFPASKTHLKHARRQESPDQPQIQQDAGTSSHNHGTQFDEHIFPGAIKLSPSPLSFLPFLRGDIVLFELWPEKQPTGKRRSFIRRWPGFVKGVLPSTTPWPTFLIRPFWHAPCQNESPPTFRCFAHELTRFSSILSSESEGSPTPEFLIQINGDQKLVVTPASCEDLGPNTAFDEGYRQACIEAAHAAYREDKT